MKTLATALLLITLLASTAHAQPALHATRQSYRDARLVNVETTSTLAFQQQSQSLSLPLGQIVRYSSDRNVVPSPSVALADGSWLAGHVQWLSDRRLRVVSKWFEPLELELDNARALQINPSTSWPETQHLRAQMLKPTGSDDVLWKRGSESRSGLSASGIVTLQIKKSVEAGAADRAVWNFRVQAGSPAVELAQADIAGITFSPILRQPTAPCPSCTTIHLVDSSVLIVKSLSRRDDGRVECVLPSGIKLLSLDESDQWVESITQITSQPAEVTWLSDLEPARYRLLDSDSTVPWSLGRNRDLFGQRLFDVRGHAIEHALMIHSPAQVAYRWDGKPSKLFATLAIQQPAANGSSAATGSIQGQVLVARDGQLVKVWQSQVIRAGDEPVSVEVDLGSTQLFVLLVDPADMGTLGDHAVWRDARVVSQ